jgi:sugar/nucleoside kinase (ribokinase family)
VSDSYDLVFVGSAGISELHRFDGTREPILGGPIFQSAMATSWSDKRVAVVSRMAVADAHLLDPLRKYGIAVFVSPAPETNRARIVYLSDNVDDRLHILEKGAGSYSMADLPPMEARLVHLVGVNRLEFPLDFMTDLRDHGFAFSIDMQALVRMSDPVTGEATFGDNPQKREVAAMVEKMKLDVFEAELLTGTADLEQAAVQFERWGTPEVMVTRADGALVRHEGQTYFERFTNRNISGRTGRGDTTFAAYLARRMDFGVAESLKFAVALASIKMETPGPFMGTLEDVLDRMRSDQLEESQSQTKDRIG